MQSVRGLEYARKALAIGEKLRSPPVICNATLFVGWHLAATGKLAEGLPHIERGWEMANQANQTFLAFMGASFRSGWPGANWRRDMQESKESQAGAGQACHRLGAGVASVVAGAVAIADRKADGSAQRLRHARLSKSIRGHRTRQPPCAAALPRNVVARGGG